MSLTVKVSCDVNAPMEVLWETLCDVKNRPTFVSRVTKVEFKKRSKNHGLVTIHPEEFVHQEGSLWVVESLFQGKTFRSIDSITSMRKPNTSDNDKTASVQISSQFLDKRFSTRNRAVHIGTFTIEALNEKRCRLHGSLGFLPGGCWGALDLWMRKRQIQKLAPLWMREYLTEFATEAEKRSGKQ
ncbi:unknown protein [Seminavis robusta]|uniref:Coenzyme Q-binding protein COQ10 START domain-containing protein n=1 Tax=Seminavis robusta TaxID=568900 RepID=A0A9N8EGB7_9STRA|nr:unknown protein [Seminavis robusta]|eukprot:Sro1154_g247210.1 n/a (185) ;mRNA; f:33480-34034